MGQRTSQISAAPRIAMTTSASICERELRLAPCLTETSTPSIECPTNGLTQPASVDGHAVPNTCPCSQQPLDVDSIASTVLDPECAPAHMVPPPSDGAAGVAWSNPEHVQRHERMAVTAAAKRGIMQSETPWCSAEPCHPIGLQGQELSLAYEAVEASSFAHAIEKNEELIEQRQV